MKNRWSALAMPALVLAGLFRTSSVSADLLPNAWQINDNAGGFLTYTINLNPGQIIASTNLSGGFRFTVRARYVEAYAGATNTMNMNYGLGTRSFQVWWGLDNNSNLTARLEGGGTYTLTSNGTGTALYHTHEILFNPTNGTASYLFDGQVITNNWPSAAVPPAPAGRIVWGASSAAGQGRMNFNNIIFQITNTTVASYIAGDQANPPPGGSNPTGQGWTPNMGGAGSSFVSPDFALLPLATTQAADQFTPTSARLNGLAKASGSPTTAWFQWGTNMSYGNATAPQVIGDGITNVSVAEVLGGLAIGPEYHFRLIASNTFGIWTGVDQFFNLADFLPSATTLAADQFTTNSARLNGQVNPNGLPTFAWFEWGTDTNYGMATASQFVGSGLNSSNISAVLSGLVGGPSYHFRLVASNTFNVAIGTNQSFDISFLHRAVGNGDGLKGVYYNNIDFTALVINRTNATVDFDWGAGSPDPAIGANTFSIRWTGQVQPQVSETYTFYTVTDDGVRLWVDNQLLVDAWFDQTATERSGSLALTAYKRYDIKMEYYESSADAVARLLWSGPSSPKSVIPQSQLYSGLQQPLPFRFQSITQVSNAAVELSLSGIPGDIQQIEVSTNLMNWTSFSAFTNITGVVTFQVPIISGEPQRFFRSVISQAP